MALFFFPGVGVVDDQVRQGEGACCFGGGDQAVNRLGLPGKGVGGRPAPRRGQRDLSVLMRVWPIEPRTPPLRRRVVVADQAWVFVRVNALMPDQARGGRDRVGGAITPVVFVVRCRERDRDVAAQQVDHVVWVGFVTETIVGMNLFVYDTVGWLFVDAGPVGVDGGGSSAQNRSG